MKDVKLSDQINSMSHGVNKANNKDYYSNPPIKILKRQQNLVQRHILC